MVIYTNTIDDIKAQQNDTIKGNLLYHWTKMNVLAEQLYEEKIAESFTQTNFADKFIGSDLIDCHLKTRDKCGERRHKAAEMRRQLLEGSPGSLAYNVALKELIDWYKFKEGFERNHFAKGMLVKANCKWFGYTINGAMDNFEPLFFWGTFHENPNVVSIRNFPEESIGLVLGEKLLVKTDGDYNLLSGTIYFQKAVYVLIDSCDGAPEFLGYGPKTNPLGPPEILETPRRPEILVCHYNPRHIFNGSGPFAEWKQA